MPHSRIASLFALIAAATVLAVAFVFAPRPAAYSADLDLQAASAPRTASQLLAGDAPTRRAPREAPKLGSAESGPQGAGRVLVAKDHVDAAPAPPGTGPPRAATLAELQDFRAFVADTLTELRASEAAAELRAIEERAERLDEILAILATRLALTQPQSDRLRSALLARFDREAEYVRLWEQGAEEDVLTKLKATDRETHEAELATFLSPEQIAVYRSLALGG